MSGEALDRAIRVQHARVLDLSIAGKPEKVLIRELQWDHLGSSMVHADFERVDEHERVKVTIPVKLKNTPKAMAGGVLDQPLHTLHVECPVIAIPEDDPHRHHEPDARRADPREGLKVPEGVKVLERRREVVVQLKLPGVEPVAAPPPSRRSKAALEPEVIKKEKKVEEEEE